MRKVIPQKIDLKVLIVFGIVIGLAYTSVLLFSAYSLFSIPFPITEVSMRAGESYCMNGNFFLTDLYQIESKNFDLLFSKDLNVGNFVNLYSSKTCLVQKRLPKENVNYEVLITPGGIAKMEQVVVVKIQPYSNAFPKGKIVEDGVNLKEEVPFVLSGTEQVFDYQISINEKIEPCHKDLGSILCPIGNFGLQQGEKYSYTIISTYNKKNFEIVGSGDLLIKTPIVIKEISLDKIKPIINLRPIIEINTDKEIELVDKITLHKKDNSKEVPIIKSFKGNVLEIKLEEDLLKSSEYILRIENMISKDGGFLNDPYEYIFSTADGPHALHSNLTSSKYNITESFLVYFDQPLSNDQQIKNFITLNPQRDFTYTIKDNVLLINPTSNLKPCESGSLLVKPGISNIYKTESSKGNTYNYKTRCAIVSSIGTSVSGRPITSYTFGSGSKTIIFFGAMHGSESNTKVLLNYWIEELEANSHNIPADKRIIVIPTLNPDGVASSTRFNANKVDLNRNFGSSDWKEESSFLNVNYPHGGGSAPFSEPESKALRNLISTYSPYLILSYHSSASYVVPNGNTSSHSYGLAYSSLSGYRLISSNQEEAFEYSITGSFGQWALESGKNSLTIELASYSSSESFRNMQAMWHMVKN